MSQDVWIFAASVALLIGYLVFSAKTEMGTKLGRQQGFKWPWKKLD